MNAPSTNASSTLVIAIIGAGNIGGTLGRGLRA